MGDPFPIPSPSGEGSQAVELWTMNEEGVVVTRAGSASMGNETTGSSRRAAVIRVGDRGPDFRCLHLPMGLLRW